MNLPEYEYKGLIAQAWDVLRGDTSNGQIGLFTWKSFVNMVNPCLMLDVAQVVCCLITLNRELILMEWITRLI